MWYKADKEEFYKELIADVKEQRRAKEKERRTEENRVRENERVARGRARRAARAVAAFAEHQERLAKEVLEGGPMEF